MCNLYMYIVVFGAVISGEDVVREIERVGSDSGKTSKTVTIISCGELDSGSGDVKRERQDGDSSGKMKKKAKKDNSGAAIKDVDC
jgi:cyclophilin family peptidyl-prolyl cis-trans isomerase